MKTIYSLVTKPINQNVGIIRISGPLAFDSIKNFIPDFIPQKNKAEFQKIKNKKEDIDDALVLSFFAPNSFTGENIIEIQCHGSMFVIKKIISELNKFGLTQAKPGEFMKQSYMNGKMDLSQIEAINTLIISENKILSEKSIENMNKKQSNFINSTLDYLGRIFSKIQVSIDYPENTDLPEYNLKNINKELKKFQIKIKKIIEDSERLIKYSKGILISLIGIPNSGKSTLLNAILNEERAIVSDIEGTTRDVIESTTYIDNIKITFQDTAGIRDKTEDIIEKEGINRAIKSIYNSDIVIQIFDGTKNLENQKKIFKKILKNNEHKIIEVITKSDLKKNRGLNISALKKDIQPLIDSIKKYISENIFDNENNNNSLLITQNQIDIFINIDNSLSSAISFIENNETIDIVAFEIESAMKKLGNIIGKEIDPDYLSNLFENFCLGK